MLERLSVPTTGKVAAPGQPLSFISKLEGGLQELEESAYWLELLVEGEVLPADKLRALQQETEELTAILVTCVKRAKSG